MAELALAWVLRRDEVASAIVGASRPEQVHANAAASGKKLPDDVVAAVDDALAGVAVTDFQHAYGTKPGVTHR
jgi:aryl-alcohol dehydrogenase-like predicted oxidoreductase